MSDTQLFNGDCLDVMPTLPAASVDLILCDLPYGTTASQPFTSALVGSNAKEFRYCWYWKKTHGSGFMNAKKMPIKIVEDVAVFYRSLPTYNPQGLVPFGKRIKTRAKFTESSAYGKIGLDSSGGKEFVQEFTGYPTSWLEFASEKGYHPTQKPVALMEYLIKTYTNEGDTVLDNCMGSGTTGVAAKNTGRRFIGIERDEKYFAICQERIGVKPALTVNETKEFPWS